MTLVDFYCRSNDFNVEIENFKPLLYYNLKQDVNDTLLSQGR
ncbi:hypothetical protein SAMN05192574_105406 [Mucilaginibacter gossypiicola]|uniref:Uncharacterized protein n=1 Tax=Mucilaginibacter gossypiicola TaxID=551995 RepID=A0A1H8M639_9SPHI|nr:hypothetical protein SAMN05192574_105406 [Mucilaginibacter gossypiicola]